MAGDYGTRKDGRVYPKGLRPDLDRILEDMERTHSGYSTAALEKVANLKVAFLNGEISFDTYFAQARDVLHADDERRRASY